MPRKLAPILFSIFLNALGFSFIFPLIPFIIKGFWGDVLLTGFAISSTAIGMAIGGVVFWYLSDHYGRKNLLLLTTFLNIAGYLLLAHADNFTIFIVARILSGLGGGGVAVAQAYIGDVTQPKDRVIMMGYVGAVLGIGFTAWPIVGSILQDLTLVEVGNIAAIVLLLSFINIAFLVPKHTTYHIEEHVHIHDILDSKKNLLALFLFLFLGSLVTAGMQTILGWYLHQTFSFTPRWVAFIFGYMGIVAILYQGIAIRYIRKILDEKEILKYGLLILALGLGSIWVAGNIISVTFIGFTLAIIGLSSVNATVYTLIANQSNSREYGKNMGIATLFTSMADIVWPIGISILYALNYNLPFYILWGVIFISIFMKRKIK